MRNTYLNFAKIQEVINWGAVEISFSRLNLFIRIPSISISFGVNSKDLRR